MIIELSNELKNAVSPENCPLLAAKINMAKYRIKIDIGKELIATGMFAPTDDDINRIFYGIPEEKMRILIASYCN